MYSQLSDVFYISVTRKSEIPVSRDYGELLRNYFSRKDIWYSPQSHSSWNSVRNISTCVDRLGRDRYGIIVILSGNSLAHLLLEKGALTCPLPDLEILRTMCHTGKSMGRSSSRPMTRVVLVWNICTEWPKILSETLRIYFLPICLSTQKKKKRVGHDSQVGIATRYELDGRRIESRWERAYSHPSIQALGGHPASYTMSTGSFWGVKRLECGVDHPPPSSAEVKEGVELYLYSTSWPSSPVIGWPLPLLLP